MEKEQEQTMFWEVGSVLEKVSFQKGECLESPKLKTEDGVSWWLDFYPSGDADDTDGLVFWLSRGDTEKEVKATFEAKLCFYTVPARQYTMVHVFERGEDSHKWVVDDVKNLQQLRIFIPTSSLCIQGFLKVCENLDSSDRQKDETVLEIVHVVNE